jgi:ribosomal protein S12 methylthiotransferase
MGLVERIRRRVPGVTLRSSFIVGFPGETARDFEELLGFLREAALEHVGVFSYSREEGTAAHALAGEVSARTKASRQGRLMRLQQKIAARRNAALVGSRQLVLVDGTDRVAGRLIGRLSTQAPEIDGCVTLEGRAVAGSFVGCEITAAGPYDLAGRVARPPTSR